LQLQHPLEFIFTSWKSNKKALVKRMKKKKKMRKVSRVRRLL